MYKELALQITALQKLFTEWWALIGEELSKEKGIVIVSVWQKTSKLVQWLQKMFQQSSERIIQYAKAWGDLTPSEEAEATFGENPKPVCKTESDSRMTLDRLSLDFDSKDPIF